MKKITVQNSEREVIESEIIKFVATDTGWNLLDAGYEFDTYEEAMKQIEKWVKDDAFDLGNSTESDYEVAMLLDDEPTSIITVDEDTQGNVTVMVNR